MNNLLVELFVEELPPKALKKIGIAFADGIYHNLALNDFIYQNDAISAGFNQPWEWFVTPRRLAVLIRDVLPRTADKQVAQKLMPASVGLDADGNATPALIKRLQGLGADASAVATLRKENDGKADVLFYDAMQAGTSLKDGLQKALEEALAKLPIPKVMTYQINDGWDSVNFVRPAHGLVALHGSEIVPVSILGLTASNITSGHRFESERANITINDADSYSVQLLNDGPVIVEYEKRKSEIREQLYKRAAYAAKLDDGLIGEITLQELQENPSWSGKYQPIQDEDLLDEVTALVERPNVLLGQFETDFLEVPQECLILTMKANQKYFPLLDASGKLTNKFLIVSNISPKDPSKVIGGNERVVRPRLADAKFFFDQDRKKTLESRLEGLNKVVYHNKLGSQGERNARVVAIAKAIAAQLGDANLVAKAELAAKLSKADLITDMVGEFPELQGIMGRYYAQHEKLDDEVAYAIEDHYKPRFAGDERPRNQVGNIVALADKLETLCGLFSIGEKPTGDKDPFALRRQALGIIAILRDTEFHLFEIKLTDVIDIALSNFNFNPSEKLATRESILEFCFDRLSVNLRDQSYSPQEVDAVLSQKPEILNEVTKKLDAVRSFASLPEAPALAAANKRVGNILKKVEGEVKAEVITHLLQEAAEKALNEALSQVKPQADKLFESGDYTASLQALAALKAPVDAFFDNVMVNADDPALKANRLGLLAILHQTMNRVADLSKLAS